MATISGAIGRTATPGTTTRVYKFRSTGFTACLLEAADYIREKNLKPEVLAAGWDEREGHFFVDLKEEEEVETTPDTCTWINPLCPSDLCVLEYDHRNAEKGHHITGSSYGSAHTSPEEQDEILKGKDSRWSLKERAPRGTSAEELFRLGCEKADEMFGKDA